eukprot:1316928-Amorphochlora_amoeboformis.AAC.1
MSSDGEGKPFQPFARRYDGFAVDKPSTATEKIPPKRVPGFAKKHMDGEGQVEGGEATDEGEAA